jgi:hypothetical protein
MLVLVKVTKEDIDDGVQEDHYLCPIALASNRGLKEQYPGLRAGWLSVGDAYLINFEDSERGVTYVLSADQDTQDFLLNFINQFDSSVDLVVPFERVLEFIELEDGV